MDRQSTASEPVPLRRLLALARPELGLLSVASLALLISSGMNLLFPQAVRWMVDAITGEEVPLDFDSLALLLVALFVVQAVFSMIRSWLFTVAGERVVARLRADLYEAILNQDVAFFDASRTGELTNRLASDTTVLQNTVTVNVSMALRFTVGTVGGVAMLVYMSPRLAGLAMLVVPFVAVGASFYGRLLRRLSKQVQDALAASTVIAEEAIGAVRTVRSFAREAEEVERYGAAVQESYRLAAKRALASGVFQGVVGFAGYSAIALVVWYGGRLVVAGEMTVGDLTAFLLYTMTVAVSLGALSGLYGDLMRAAGASQRVFELMDQRPTLEGEGAILDEVRGEVRLEDVRFSYPSRPDMPVLQGLTMGLPRGKVVALVGPSGAGKSTVAQLLARFYDPDSGRITVDGVHLSTLAPRPWRTHVGAVAQEPVLFAASVTENIRYGRPEATLEQVRAAARAANAEGFIEGFPEGFETSVGERGVRLSGGQKQRIAIARALLKDPQVLILDEATSALDTESEHLVQEALERLMSGRTTLVIAHRLSTVRDADQVLVLDQGKVAERGTHDELLAMGGLYRRLVERQFSLSK